MRTPSFLFGIIALMSSSFIEAQVTYSRLTAPETEYPFEFPGAFTEVPSKRNLHCKVFEDGKGKIVYQTSSSPLNYQDDHGQWQTISWKPEVTSNGFLAARQNNPVALYFDGSVEIANNTGSLFKLSTVSVFGTQISDEPINKNYIDPRFITSRNQLFCYLTSDVLQRSEFRHNGIKIDYIVPDPLDWQDASITQQLFCPADWTLIDHPVLKGALRILDPLKNEMGILYPVVCKDSKGSEMLGRYKYTPNSNGYSIELVLDADWFKKTERTYPVIIDPLIVGPTSQWTTTYMPSCFMPSYNTDSLQVAIPGQTTITGVYVSGSYYADPWAGAIKSQGFMHFSTSCGATQDLSVYAPANGWDQAGTAYASNFDYRNPLTCCLGPSCSDRTFYVRMHLGRNAGGTGCNTTYIYHDPFGGFPFMVYVEGHTPEATSTQWNVTPATVCSDQCSLNIKPFVRYGVPPYTITHPWASSSVTLGTPVYTCSLAGSTVNIPVTRPNCPLFCDTTSVLNIPLLSVIDACGNSVTGWPARTVSIKPAPQIIVSTDSIDLCSNEPVVYNFQVCPPGTQVDWSSGSTSGINTIDTVFQNTGLSVQNNTFTANAVLNGCAASTQTLVFNVSPNPVANAVFPNVGFLNQPIQFSDHTDYTPSDPSNVNWSFGDGSYSTDSIAQHAYTAPGNYLVCLFVNSSAGCKDTVCDTIQIIPAEIKLPNVVTMNGDGVNDVLYFQYLPMYGICSLSVFNRWGEIVYESDNYQNNWAPDKATDGTYFYILNVPGHDPYTSTLNIFSK